MFLLEESMDFIQAIEERHSVRSYNNTPISNETVEILNAFIKECNIESGLNVQLVLNEPNAFNCLMAHYGKFSGVSNYIAIVGNKSKSIYEKIGYYGEKIVLYAQTLGLNTCWVALTYKKQKQKVLINEGEKIHVVISIGYGVNNGCARKSKGIYEVCAKKDYPKWFVEGIKCALLAPTAMNQQKFYFALSGNNEVSVKSRKGFYSKMDLGIVKLHFEIGAGLENFTWKN